MIPTPPHPKHSSAEEPTSVGLALHHLLVAAAGAEQHAASTAELFSPWSLLASQIRLVVDSNDPEAPILTPPDIHNAVEQTGTGTNIGASSGTPLPGVIDSLTAAAAALDPPPDTRPTAGRPSSGDPGALELSCHVRELIRLIETVTGSVVEEDTETSPTSSPPNISTWTGEQP